MIEFEHMGDYKLTNDDLPIGDFIIENYDELKSRICVDEFGEKIFSHLVDYAGSEPYIILDYIEWFAVGLLKYHCATVYEDKYLSYYFDLTMGLDLLMETIEEENMSKYIEQRDIDYRIERLLKFYNVIKYGEQYHKPEDLDLSIFNIDNIFDLEKLQKIRDEYHDDLMKDYKPGV